MRNRVVLSLLLFACHPFIAAEPAAKPKGLVVHEWGVFRVNDNVDFANAYLRAEWDDLPQFAYGHIKGRVVPQHWGAFEERAKPIIFFHADAPTQVHVKVDFPGGMAGVWFPATESPAVEEFERQPKIGSALVWNLAIKQMPKGWQPKSPSPPEVSDKHWINGIRQVKSDEIFARFGPGPNDVEREKFIYYDGIFPQGKWMKIAIEKDNVSLTSLVKHPVFDVTVVDRRGKGETVRIGRVARLAGNETIKEVTFTEVDTSRFPSEATETLLKQLVAAGLFEDEAKSLTDQWKKRMFETPGVNLFYRLPKEIYDQFMPLTLTPAAESVVRVGLIYHGHLEPDFAARVLELVKQLDAPKFADRDSAIKKLHAIGPAAMVQIIKIKSRKDLSVEVRERIELLMKKWSSMEAFDK